MTSLLIGIMLMITAPFAFQGATPTEEPEATPVLPALDANAPVYLALGDSLAFGVGASDAATTGYVPLLHEMLQASMPGGADLQLANISEDGGTTTSLLEYQLPLALELLAARNGDDTPDNDVKVITVDIGANDAFRPLQEVCGAGLSEACTQAVAEVFTTVSQNLGTALGQMRAAAGPDTAIVAMTYFNTLITCDLSAIAPAADLVLEGAPDGSVPGLNDVIREVAAQTDVLVAETYGLVGAEDLVGGTDCRHPNDAGHQKIADAFAAVLLGGPATPVALLAEGARW